MKRSNLVWVVIAVLVVALLGTGIFIYMQHKAMSDFKEQVEIDKQRSELEKEYSDLAAQYATACNNNLLKFHILPPQIENFLARSLNYYSNPKQRCRRISFCVAFSVPQF